MFTIQSNTMITFLILFLLVRFDYGNTTTTSTTSTPKSVGTPIKRSYHGEACSSQIKCVRGSWLSCRSGVCACLKPDEMVYDIYAQKCVAKSGGVCRYALDQSDSSNIVYEITGCVPNATCTSGGLCQCDSKFYEDPVGNCALALGQGESCKSGGGDECSRFQKLYCKEGICKCDESASIYSDDLGQCIGLVGQACINSKCIQHAVCSTNTNTCECPANFHTDSDQKCIPNVEPLQKCTRDSQCLQKSGQEFGCVKKGVCDCKASNISIYATVRATTYYGIGSGSPPPYEGPQLSQCVGLVDSPCIKRLCVPYAFCFYTSTSGDWSSDPSNRLFGTCKCHPGFTKSKAGTCGAPFMTPCVSTSYCADGLSCRSSNCLCPSKTQTYDPQRKLCISRIGGPCRDTLFTFTGCGRNSECVPIGGPGAGSSKPKQKNAVQKDEPEPEPGHCACKEGYTENPDGTGCVAKYGSSCKITTDCDPTNGQLECIDQKCDCPAFSIYNENVKKCLGLVGAQCPDTTGSWCAENSFCSRQQTDFHGHCTCNSGYKETHNYTCQGSGVVLIGVLN